ncbi:MAG: motility protein A [Deltaproteobacteria bacterium]|nr:motility protein A [Deltaproteobacteria bacterium]MBW2151764.1 motility protein A [Deltaproteobacteria bacterium]
MDLATILGIVSAFGLVIIAIAMGGGVSLFINIPSLMIVVGGTMGATMINYPLKDVLRAISIVKNAFFSSSLSADEIVKQFVGFGGKARREGILALEADIKNIDDEFLSKGLQLSVDGLEPQAIETIMDTEVEFLRERHQLGAEIFSTMGTFAPALGMIGTLIGLVQMLQSMDDPSGIGPAMAVALLTTFYGSVMANLVYMPIAGKLRTRSKEETLVKEMIIQGIISLTKGENPRILEQKMLAFLAPKERKSSF